jgi:hypothetical protein
LKYFILAAALALASTGFASDHNNIEHGRPLLFDDAYSIAFGEREFQVGLNSSGGKFGLMTSFGYGFAKNQELSFGFNTFQGSNNGYEISYFRNLAREFEKSPALGYRITANATRGQRSEVQARLIATKAWHQYDKVHVNIDINTNESPGFILGYSTPLGYPKKFDQTFVSEISVQGKDTSFGAGIRRQIDSRSVLDVGIRAGRETNLTIGYSIGF